MEIFKNFHHNPNLTKILTKMQSLENFNQNGDFQIFSPKT